jgi:hypothetical protein
MLKGIKWALIFIGIFVIIFIVWWVRESPFKINRPVGVPLDQILIREQIRDIAELSALEIQFADYQEHHWIEKKGIGYTNHKHALIVGSVNVKIGFDLSLTEVLIDSASKQIEVILPQPTVFQPNFIKKQIYDKLPIDAEADSPLFDYVKPLTVSESDSLFELIKVAAVEKARSEENYLRARKNANFILQGILLPLAQSNNYDLKINFKQSLEEEGQENRNL